MLRSLVKPLRLAQKGILFPQARFRFFSEASKLEIDPDVETQVIELMKDFLEGVKDGNVSKLDKTATFEELGMDSLDAMDLIVELEEAFGFDISNEDAENHIRSVKDAAAIFTAYKTGKRTL